MKALSIKQPWLWAITDMDKRVENRTWHPPYYVIGERIALHASKKEDKEGRRSINIIRAIREPIPPIDLPNGAIVATAIIRGFVNSLSELPHRQHRWFFGPYGWLLDDVVKLTTPINCRGRLGLWDVPLDIIYQINPSKLSK